MSDLNTVRRLTGVALPDLRPHETLTGVAVSDDAVTLSYVTHTIVETAREIRLTGRKMRVVCLKRTDGVWAYATTLEIADETFVPVTFAKYEVRTAKESIERRRFEQDCYRPGTDRAPLDNYTRVLAGAYGPSESKIERHW